MRINHNIAALNTHRQLNSAANAQGKSMEKLSSGLRINRAGDDAAGLAISEKMRAQIKGLDMASRNAQDGISLIQTAEGALNETHDILQRMRELAVQSSNDTATSTDRGNIQDEMDQLAQEITRIADTTEFNKQTLMGSSAQFNGTFQIGANGNQSLSLSINKMDSASLGVGNAAAGNAAVSEIAFVAGTGDELIAGGVGLGSYTQSTNLDVKFEVKTIGDGSTAGTAEVTINGVTKTLTSTGTAANSGYTLSSADFGDIFESGNSITLSPAGALEAADEINIEVKGASSTITGIDVKSSRGAAEGAIATIDQAIADVSGERSKLGAVQNRLEHTINNLGTSSENLTAAESRIRDVDYALAA